MKSGTGRPLRKMLALIGLAGILFAPATSNAGVVDGVQTVDGLTFYLGVVPAAIAQGHPPGHPEASMHGGTPGPSMHNMHLLVALFNGPDGARITRAKVVAQILERGGKEWSVQLQPMTVNGALTFGGYATLEKSADYSIEISVDRLGAVSRVHPVTANFTWAHD